MTAQIGLLAAYAGVRFKAPAALAPEAAEMMGESVLTRATSVGLEPSPRPSLQSLLPSLREQALAALSERLRSPAALGPESIEKEILGESLAALGAGRDDGGRLVFRRGRPWLRLVAGSVRISAAVRADGSLEQVVLEHPRVCATHHHPA
jgi:hypothetical protein